MMPPSPRFTHGAAVFLCKFFLTPFLLLAPAAASGQSDEQLPDELLETLARQGNDALEGDAPVFSEREFKLDLNRAGREELHALGLLDALQIEQFLAYRARLGPFLNNLELQAVPGWDLDLIRRVLTVAEVTSSVDARYRPLWQGLYRGTNEWLLRWNPAGKLPTAPEGGNTPALALRWRHRFDGRLQYGFTAENDPGEALFRGSNRRGFDFMSAHLFARGVNKHIQTLALGDFIARLGQGLLLQTGFAPGKSAESCAIARGGAVLSPYSTFGEAFFLRGGGATVSLGKRWQLTALASHRRRDAALRWSADSTERHFTSFQTSGLHRTASERAGEKSVWETLGAASVQFEQNNLVVRANGIWVAFDRPWLPDPAPERLFRFRGRRQSGLGVDYAWRRRNGYFFGELARSANGALAWVQGLLLMPERRVTLALLARRLPRHYQAVYAAPFAETSGAANENGLYAGIELRPHARWRIHAYADLWRHPWLRFGAGGPSHGADYLGRITWAPAKTFSVYLLAQQQIRQSNGAENTGLLHQSTGRLRLHAAYKALPALEFRGRVEQTWSRTESGAPARGYLAFQEAIYKPLGKPLSLALRYAVFDTQDYETRVYAYERDLFSALSIPAFAGEGARAYLNVSVRLNKWLRLEGRWERTWLRRAATETAEDTVGGQAFKVQMRMKL